MERRVLPRTYLTTGARSASSQEPHSAASKAKGRGVVVSIWSSASDVASGRDKWLIQNPSWKNLWQFHFPCSGLILVKAANINIRFLQVQGSQQQGTLEKLMTEAKELPWAKHRVFPAGPVTNWAKLLQIPTCKSLAPARLLFNVLIKCGMMDNFSKPPYYMYQHRLSI